MSTDLSLLLLIAGIIGIALVIVFFSRKNTSMAPMGEVVPKALYSNAVEQVAVLQEAIQQKEQELREISAQLAARDQQLLHVQQTLQTQRAESEQMQRRVSTEFENIANRLLEQKAQHFNQQQTQQLQLVLQPLREKIKEFEENIERKFVEETREKSGLKKEIEQLFSLNQQLSHDAHNLATALKGQSKVQGDWGEWQLEVLLEKAGLQKGLHFSTQGTYKDDDGAAKRPDFIIQLPDSKQLIIDAKVSLTAFERYFNDEDPTQRDKHLKAHVDSMRAHIDGLSKRNYQMLYQISTPDYLLLFVPLEGALNTAMQAEPKLFTEALERNIILVSTSSLLATMRTVAHLWKQEKQTRSVQEIARQSGLLYDRFVAFVEDLRTIGARLDSAQMAYGDAMNKLTTATRPGDTLIGRAEKIKELGAKATKSLPADLIDLDQQGVIDL